MNNQQNKNTFKKTTSPQHAGSFPARISSQQFRDLLENVSMMVVMLDTAGQVIFCNDDMLNHLEMARSDLEGKNWFDIFVAPDQLELERRKFKEGLVSGKITFSFTHHFLTQSGVVRTYIWKDSFLRNARGEVEFIVCFGNDITEQKKNENDRFQLLETLEQHVADRTLELETLYTVATTANEVLELPMMLEKMLLQTLKAISVPYGAIHLFDNDMEELHLVAQVGISPVAVRRISSITTGFGLTGWVAQSKQTLTLTNVSNDPRILSIGQVSGYSLYLSAPLISQNKVLGVISVFGDTAQHLNPERVALLTTVADQIGTAVERAQLRQQVAQTAILEERQRVAREMHDSVTQSIYSLTLLAAAGQRSALDGSMERTNRNLESISLIAFQTLKEMRLLVYELQPSTLGSGGLAEAIQRRLDAVEEHSGMHTQLIVEHEILIPKTVEIELFGLTQEALNNSIKHGQATSVTVRLDQTGDSVLLEVCDNGKGFDLNQAEKKHGTGLISMYKRVESLCGQLEIKTSPEKGTCITALVPKAFNKNTLPLSFLENHHD